MQYCIDHRDKFMSNSRTERTEYQLRERLRQDYHRQLQGPPISQRALFTTAIDEATHESIAAPFEEREATQEETDMTTEVDQLAALVAQIVRSKRNASSGRRSIVENRSDARKNTSSRRRSIVGSRTQSIKSN